MSSNLAILRFGAPAHVETEWERIVYELGAIAAIPYLAFRSAFAIWLLSLGLKQLRAGNYLCPLLCGACVLEFVTGNFRQVTTLGFAMVCSGLCLAAAKIRVAETHSESADTEANPLRLLGKGRLSIGRGL
jgi:hypothetical protein